MKYVPIIGLEIHVQLKTKSKMFCATDNSAEDKKPNTAVCPICMGHPGTLPIINEQAVKWGILAALALNCKIADFTKFDRKNYFYPDLPKGYQISQYDKPLAENGYLIIDVDGQERKIDITRLHMEEDAAKNFHSEDGKHTLVDYNRAGTPLAEIVTEPDFRSAKEAKIFLQELRKIMRYLEISDADMEKGQLRCDANISLVPKKEFDTGKFKYYPKTEIKNLNSFKSVEKALEYEIQRQTKFWLQNTPPKEQSTRGWNEAKQITEEQRVKEEAHDYRYFPEPDLPPLTFKDEEIKKIKADLPELPRDKKLRFVEQFGFNASDAQILTDNKAWSKYAEEVITELKSWLLSLEEVEGTEEEIWQKNKSKLIKLVSGWLINKLGALINESQTEIKDLKINPENFAEFISIIYKGKIGSSAAQEILEEMFKTGQDPSHILQDKNLGQIDNTAEIEQIAKKVIKNNPKQAEEYKSGKEALLKFFVGQVMKESKGRANPSLAEELLKKELK